MLVSFDEKTHVHTGTDYTPFLNGFGKKWSGAFPTRLGFPFILLYKSLNSF